MILSVEINQVKRGRNKDYINYDGYPLYKGVHSVMDENGITWKPNGFAFKVLKHKIRGEVENDQTCYPTMAVFAEHIEDYLKLLKDKQ